MHQCEWLIFNVRTARRRESKVASEHEEIQVQTDLNISEEERVAVELSILGKRPVAEISPGIPQEVVSEEDLPVKVGDDIEKTKGGEGEAGGKEESQGVEKVGVKVRRSGDGANKKLEKVRKKRYDRF